MDTLACNAPSHIFLGKDFQKKALVNLRVCTKVMPRRRRHIAVKAAAENKEIQKKRMQEAKEKKRDKMQWWGLPATKVPEKEVKKPKYVKRSFEEKHPMWRSYRIKGFNTALIACKDNKDAYVPLIRKCGKERAITDAKLIHDRIEKKGFLSDVRIANLLVEMYGRLKETDDARLVFDTIEEPNEFSWSLMMECYVQNKQFHKALDFYYEMETKGVFVDAVITSAINCCAHLRALADGRRIHAAVVAQEIDPDFYLGAALINMYGRCRCLEDAVSCFQDMKSPEEVRVYAAMIKAYVECEHMEEAMNLYWQMRADGAVADVFVYRSILGACRRSEDLLDGKHIHKHILEAEYGEDIELQNELIKMYGRCRSIVDARFLFSMMRMKDVNTWNAIIAANSQMGYTRDALDNFYMMQSAQLLPNADTYASVLAAFRKPKMLEQGRSIHASIEAKKIPDANGTLMNSVIDMYINCCSLDDAKKVFDKLENRTLGAWNRMLLAYIHFEEWKLALWLYRRMLLEGMNPDECTFCLASDTIGGTGRLIEGKLLHGCAVEAGFQGNRLIGTALVKMYGKCGSLEDAREAFKEIKSRKDSLAWDSIVEVNAEHGEGNESLKMFQKMNCDGVKPDESSILTLLLSCSDAGLIEQGIEYFTSMSADYFTPRRVRHYIGLVCLLGRAGWTKQAEFVVDAMTYHDNLAAWVALLRACKVHGDLKRGARAAREIFRINPAYPWSYVLVSNIYSAFGRMDSVVRVRRMMRYRRVVKPQGCSSIELGQNVVHEFVENGNELDRQHDAVRGEVDRLYRIMKQEHAYAADTNDVFYLPNSNAFHDESTLNKEQLLKYHSAKMAMGLGLISTTSSVPLRIVKNIRLCSDCHVFGKLVSKITSREIMLRDLTRFHHFKDGICSCGEYW